MKLINTVGVLTWMVGELDLEDANNAQYEEDMPEEHYCTKCGGTDVITSTSADLWWDAVKQEYVISSICDGGTDHCDTCWAETVCDWRPVTDKKTLEKIAKHDLHTRR